MCAEALIINVIKANSSNHTPAELTAPATASCPREIWEWEFLSSEPTLDRGLFCGQLGWEQEQETETVLSQKREAKRLTPCWAGSDRTLGRPP